MQVHMQTARDALLEDLFVMRMSGKSDEDMSACMGHAFVAERASLFADIATMQRLTVDNEQLRADNEQLRADNEQLVQRIETLNSSIETLNSSVATLQRQLRRTEADNVQLREDVVQLREEKEAIRAALTTLGCGFSRKEFDLLCHPDCNVLEALVFACERGQMMGQQCV